MYESINMFEAMNPRYKIKKPIRLIELFAGIGSQAKALKNIKANFETYKVVEYDLNAIKSYNAIHCTDFGVLDITKITSNDLCIVDTDKYEYIMTYSFPCQDLSLAGKRKGMEKGSSTRSGLLWEVERLLKGCEELPQILLMENVPQVVGKENFKDFREWEIFLEGLGYSNYFELLNAKDYGIPQSRNRCFMVSILGDFYYQFPHKKKLELRLKDMLEKEVDEKYYLSEKALNGLKNTQFQCSKIENRVAKDGIIPTRLDKTLEKNSIEDGDFIDSYNQIIRKGISGTITTRVSESNNTFVAVPEKTKRGYAEAHVGDGIYINRPHQNRGVVQKDMIQTIKTQVNDIGVVVENKVNRNNIKNINNENGVFSTLGTNCGSSTSAGGGDVVVENNIIPFGSYYTWGDKQGKYNTQCNRAASPEKCALTIACTEPGKVINNLRIRKLTPKECWRLMGFSDTDFDKASKTNSNSQLYKQAGNSIVVNVLEEIFKMLF